MSILVNATGNAKVVEDKPKTTAAATAQSQNNATGSDKVTAPKTTAAGTTSTTQEAVSTGNEGNKSNAIDFSTVQMQYDGQYDQEIADLYNQIVNRAPFQYRSDEDQMYQQYMDRYIKGGQMAMQDTMGQLAGLTGGYGNSYAQNVGQQAYDEYMTGLNDKALELSQAAYQRYADEGDRLNRQYAMLGDLAADDYAKWGDNLDRAMQYAALLGSSGDFTAYGQMLGEDAEKNMLAAYAAEVLMPQYLNGQIDAEEYKRRAGVYPVGYVAPGSGGGGNDGGSWYTDRVNAANRAGVSLGMPGYDAEELNRIFS